MRVNIRDFAVRAVSGGLVGGIIQRAMAIAVTDVFMTVTEGLEGVDPVEPLSRSAQWGHFVLGAFIGALAGGLIGLKKTNWMWAITMVLIIAGFIFFDSRILAAGAGALIGLIAQFILDWAIPRNAESPVDIERSK
jgi:hypothetical protein